MTPPHSKNYGADMVEQIAIDFDGATYDRELDGSRLRVQLEAVKKVLSDGKPHTILDFIYCSGSEAGQRARIRDLRKVKFGRHVILRARETNGLFSYRMALCAQCRAPLDGDDYKATGGSTICKGCRV